MELIIKNRFTLNKGSTVKTKDGKDVFYVKGNAISLSKKKTLLDLNKKPLYIIKNRIFNFFGYYAFIFSPSGKKIATVRRKVGLSSQFFIEGLKSNLFVKGNVFEFNYEILDDGKMIGKINRQFNIVNDTFLLNINEGVDPAFIVAIVIAIDNITDKRNRK